MSNHQTQSMLSALSCSLGIALYMQYVEVKVLMQPIIVLHGKARRVWKAWAFVVAKLGSRTLGELSEEIKR